MDYKQIMTKWHIYGPQTCYETDEFKQVFYCDSSYFKLRGYKIVEAK